MGLLLVTVIIILILVILNPTILDDNNSFLRILLLFIGSAFGKNIMEGFFQNKELCSRLYLTKKNRNYNVLNKMINKDMCESIIKEAEDFAEIYGWTTNRHDNYPTTDNQITYEWNTYNRISNYIHSRVFKALEKLYNVNSYELGINEMFVAKYQNIKNKQNRLAEHVDGSEFSFIIALNDDYTGGGTHFTETKETIKLKAGDCLIFSGQNKHKGVKVLTGTRYILTGFMNYKSYNYCHDVL
jgi:hypothetical protein